MNNLKVSDINNINHSTHYKEYKSIVDRGKMGLKRRESLFEP